MALAFDRIKGGSARVSLACIAVFLLCVGFPSLGGSEAPADSHIRFVGKNLFSTAKGTFHSWHVVDSVVWPEGLAGSHIVVEVDLASVDTDSARRDEHLRTADFFDVERFPTATVRAHSAEASGFDAEGRKSYNAKFDLDLHGVNKTLDGEFVVLSASPFVAEGKLFVNRLDFGVGPPPSAWNPMSIGAEIPVTFRVSLP